MNPVWAFIVCSGVNFIFTNHKFNSLLAYLRNYTSRMDTFLYITQLKIADVFHILTVTYKWFH